jgi:hypothetical protein
MKSRANADSFVMNRRTEARFQVYSRATLIRLKDPAREQNVSLTDVSGAGFQVLADEELPAGDMIVLETDAHLILAEVRHSRGRGERFAIGAQRVQTLSKLDLPDDTGRVQRIQILINDYQEKMGKESAIPTRAPEPEVVEPARVTAARVIEDDARQDVFEPRPISRTAKPAFPKLQGAPSGFIRFTPNQAS